MSELFCDNCDFLDPKENEQFMGCPPHRCNKTRLPLKHGALHPHILRPAWCPLNPPIVEEKKKAYG